MPFKLPIRFATTPAGSDLPIGLQIAARPFNESLVLQVAHAYEQQTSWHRKKPPVEI
jgi:aspartyl-tRNA(Asn)/glutamyl-tRNA(Gln) amidotransferase subunit A